MSDKESSRVESELEVNSYIQKLQYAIRNGASITLQEQRVVDDQREEEYTNRYTISHLFPDENPTEALRRELSSLTVENYIRTVRDLRFPKRSEFREFGKVYDGEGDVYIKIRVELLGMYGESFVFIMSFHFAERAFTPEMFPYRKR